jgi:50S ribosomal protein L16 3-hydroxylase
MLNTLRILNHLPTAAEFYENYWNKRPFVVKEALANQVIDGLISADELAGLSMEVEPRSRLVKSSGKYHDWSCRFGPFKDNDFDSGGDADWCLLIQNVEQFHPNTAHLLTHFNFAPRWLMDDVMVSYSSTGGSVGPHVDSYHVFLVQGQGKRRWTISKAPIAGKKYIKGLELKVLDCQIDGDEIEVTLGDVLYLPPNFAHEGITVDPALTFSIGFLGPKMSELYSAFAQYISEKEDLDTRFVGIGLGIDSAGFEIGHGAVDHLQSRLGDYLNGDLFAQWLVEFFTESSHQDLNGYNLREDYMGAETFDTELRLGSCLKKPEYVKFVITTFENGRFCLGFDSHSFVMDESTFPVIRSLMKEETINLSTYPMILGQSDTRKLLMELYNHHGLEFTSKVCNSIKPP